MPARVFCFVVLVWAATVGTPLQAQPVPPAVPITAPARIVGRVVDPLTGAGMAAAGVNLRGESRATTTDGEGRFVFEGVSRGPHALVVTLEGFEPSPPHAIEIGDEAEVTVELEYRLSIVAEVRAPAPWPDRVGVPSATATLVEGRQIATQPGSLDDVSRVLQMGPGVAASQDNRNDLIVRGAGPIETETRVDGFSLPNASHFGGQGGTGGGISMVAPWLIDRAMLETGGFSVVFGERASSVVDLQLRRGSDQRIGGAVAAGVGGGLVFAGGPLPRDRGTWLFSIRRSFLEIVADQGSDTVIPRYVDAIAKLDVQLSDRHRLELLALGGRDDVVSRSKPDNFETFRDEQSIGLAAVRIESVWNAATSSRVAASFSANDLSVVARDRRAIDFSDNSRERELRLSGDVTRQIGAIGKALLGLSLKRASLSFDLYEEALRNAYNNPVASVRSKHDDEFVDAAGYAELSSAVGSRVRTRVGLRVDRSGSTRKAYASPRLRVEYLAGRSVRLTGAWGVYRQGIPYIWIGSNPGNASLDPVKSHQLVTGVELSSGNATRIIVEGFDKRYTGYPVDPAAPPRVLISALSDFESPFVGALVGAGRVRARGVDSALVTRTRGGVEAGLVYSFWKVSQQGLDGVWRPGDYDISHQARLNLGFTWRRLRSGASWRYASGRPYTPFDVAASIKANAGRYDRTRINGTRYPPYHRLDARLEWTVRKGRVSFVMYGEVNNAYNRANTYIYEWDRAAKGPKPVGQWGRTPVGGVRLEF